MLATAIHDFNFDFDTTIYSPHCIFFIVEQGIKNRTSRRMKGVGFYGQNEHVSLPSKFFLQAIECIGCHLTESKPIGNERRFFGSGSLKILQTCLRIPRRGVKKWPWHSAAREETLVLQTIFDGKRTWVLLSVSNVLTPDFRCLGRVEPLLCCFHWSSLPPFYHGLKRKDHPFSWSDTMRKDGEIKLGKVRNCYITHFIPDFLSYFFTLFLLFSLFYLALFVQHRLSFSFRLLTTAFDGTDSKVYSFEAAYIALTITSSPEMLVSSVSSSTWSSVVSPATQRNYNDHQQ